MHTTIDGRAVYCHRSDAAAASAQAATLVLIHGALNDHTVWLAQSRGLARQGYTVLAPDLPGHGGSAGPALDSVDAMADWLLALLDAAGVARACLVGHSMGSLIALEAAARAPARVSALALLGSSAPMRVADALLATARDDPAAAIAMIATWSHAARPAAGIDPAALEALSRQLMGRVADAGLPGLLHTDLSACNAYANGTKAAAGLACPVLFVLGRQDKMTPPRAAQALVAALKGTTEGATVVELDAGHAMMAELPDAVLAALVDFSEASQMDCRPGRN